MLEVSRLKPVISFKDVWVEYRLATGLFSEGKKILALRGVSFDVVRGEVYGIVGASGSGKSTLLKTIMGFVKPVRGVVEVEGVDLFRIDKRTRKSIIMRIGYVPQNPYNAVNPRFKVKHIIAEPLKAAKASRSEIEKLLSTLVGAVGLETQVLELLPHELSLGMLQRVVIARAIAVKPRILLLDEPTSALDTVTQSHIISLLRELKEMFGYTCVLVSHDLKVVSKLANRIAIMMAGLLVEEGPTDRVVKEPLHPYTKELVESLEFKEVREVLIPLLETCPFYVHCPKKLEKCAIVPPLMKVDEKRAVRCWNLWSS